MNLPLPEQLTPEQWEGVTLSLIWLWAFVGTMVLGAGSMMVAHILIPSLVETRHISSKFNSFRPVIYGLAVVAFAGAIFVFASFVISLETFFDIYPDVWV